MRTRGLLGDDKRPEYPEVPDTTCSDCGKAAEIDAEEGVCRECYDRLAGVRPVPSEPHRHKCQECGLTITDPRYALPGATHNDIPYGPVPTDTPGADE